MLEYRICEVCNYHNKVASLVCEQCFADLSFVHPTFVEEKSEGAHFVKENEQTDSPQIIRTVVMRESKIVDIKTGYEITIPLEGGTIGRSGTISSDYFQNNLYISNVHASFRFNGGTLTVIDENSTNGTKLNGNSLVAKKEYELKNNDIVTFANMEFRVVK